MGILALVRLWHVGASKLKFSRTAHDHIAHTHSAVRAVRGARAHARYHTNINKYNRNVNKHASALYALPVLRDTYVKYA